MKTEHELPKTEDCTSWIVFSDFTKNNTNILHKNRDAMAKTICAYKSPDGVQRKWIALGSDPASVNAGINISGLAGVMNSGEPCIDPPCADNSKKSTPAMMRAILESCDNAKQAVAKLQELIDAGDYWHDKKGSIFFFCDTEEGYICETTAKDCSVQCYTRGYAVRANIWQNPNMYERSRNTIDSYLNSSARAYITMSTLNKALDDHGSITLPDIFETSRHHQMPEDCPLKRSVCGQNTNSGASLEIDRQYPGILSTLYVTMGPPRCTVYVPIPICAETLHPAMGIDELRFSNAAWKRLDELGYDAPIPGEWSKFETESLATFTKTKEQARELLNNGKQEEAVKLINATAEAIWVDAVKLLEL